MENKFNYSLAKSNSSSDSIPNEKLKWIQSALIIIAFLINILGGVTQNLHQQTPFANQSCPHRLPARSTHTQLRIKTFNTKRYDHSKGKKLHFTTTGKVVRNDRFTLNFALALLIKNHSLFSGGQYWLPV